MKVGWTVGTGVEDVVSGDWTAKIEYLYIDLGKRVGIIYDADRGSGWSLSDQQLQFACHRQYPSRRPQLQIGRSGHCPSTEPG
jgi:hypothetical protein